MGFVNGMKTRPTIQELQADRDEALRPLGLLTNRTPPDFLQGLDPDALGKALRQVDMPWGDEGLYPEAARLLAAIRQTEEGLRLCLETELSHLRGLASAAGERTLQGPLGLIETAFPVRARGVTVHCLWSGKLRDRPFTPAEIDEIARLSGSSRAAAAELASAVPVLE